jgi:D-hydroxyproline dehydrogenase subunit beta
VSATTDVVIVGAGVVGAAVAWRLATEKVRVRVLEAAFPGGGNTAAAMGHVVVMDDSPAQLAFTAWSRALLRELVPELPPACEPDRCGTLWIAEEEGGLGAVRAKAERLTPAGVGCEVLGARELAEAEPALVPGLAGALRVPDDLVVYPPALAAWFLGRALDAGATVETGVRATRIAGGRDGGAGTPVVTAEGGRYEAGAVVNAAGVAAPALSPGLPVSPRRGHLAITDRYPGTCRHQLVELGYLESAHAGEGESVAFNLQPRRNGQLLVGSSREPGEGGREIRWALLSRMLARARAFVPALGAMSVTRSWTGIRPATADGLPLVGPWRPVPGTWVAAGHEGLGITTALGTAHLLADLLLGRRPAFDPAPFDPHREQAGWPHPSPVAEGP